MSPAGSTPSLGAIPQTGLRLRAGAFAGFFGEKDVVVLARIEGRVEVDEVDGLVGDVAAEDVEVVAVEELIFRHRRVSRRVTERRGLE